MTDLGETLNHVQVAMAEGARLDIVRLFNPRHPWGVQVWEQGRTRGGNDKWIKVCLLLPNDGETLVDLLTLLGNMTLEEEQ